MKLQEVLILVLLECIVTNYIFDSWGTVCVLILVLLECIVTNKTTMSTDEFMS